MPDPPKTLLVYADGSCLGNPGPGGWGVVIVKPGGAKEELSGGEAATTNNRMELTAAIEALRRIERASSLVLRSDSEYLVRSINEKWKRKKNLDLWQQLEAEIALRKVRFEWVKGHGDDPLNDRADELARTAAEKIARGAPSAAASSERCDPERRSADDTARELKPMLREDETIRRCAGCGRMFVSKRALYCTQIECQLKARRTAPAR